MDYIYQSSFLNPKFFPFLKFLGCFSIGSTSVERTKVIFAIRGLLKAGCTILLFPEGGITKEKNVRDLKQGIDFFMKDAPNVMFIRLEGLNGIRRTKNQTYLHKVTFGQVFEPPPIMTLDEMREYLDTLDSSTHITATQMLLEPRT